MARAREKKSTPREKYETEREPAVSRAHNFPPALAEMELFIGGSLLTRTDNRPPVATGDRRRGCGVNAVLVDRAHQHRRCFKFETDEDG